MSRKAFVHNPEVGRMPKRLRKVINRLSSKRKGRNQDDTEPSGENETSDLVCASLLGLPPEIRNQIYENLAEGKSLPHNHVVMLVCPEWHSRTGSNGLITY